MCVSKLLVLTMYFFYGKLSSEVAHVCFTCDTFLIFGGYVICISCGRVVRDFESEAKTRCNFQFR